MIAAVLFWICVLAMLHSYVVYPFILWMLAKGKSPAALVYGKTDELPDIVILMSVHNEEAVLPEKIESIYRTKYPLNKLQVYIGSDASTDGTNGILESCKGRYPGFYPVLFRDRSGKIRIINTLCKTLHVETRNALLVMTDANVLFEENTLFHMAKHFRDPAIGLVSANVRGMEGKRDGIAFQETSYVHRENMIKYREGLVWGAMMGAFGACYAMRSDLFKPVPEHHKVDDFFLTLVVLERGQKTICDLEAICHEDVSNEIKEEFRRKVRIATGNFQNLQRFKSLLWPPYTPLAFSFFSHKVLRWLGPFFIIIAYVANLWLWQWNKFYHVTFIIQNLLLLAPLVDALLKRVRVQTVLLRFIAYFYYMNLALLAGFIKYLKGGQENVWQPTKRNQ